MKWTSQAEEAISKVPFFVRRRVRKKVEEEAMRDGAAEVRLEHVRRCQRKFLEQMEEEVKGYQVEVPCCQGLPVIIKEGMELAGKRVPMEQIVISTRGEILERERLVA